MKLFTIAAGILCLTSSVSGVVDKSAQKYTKIDFPPPLNWDPKESFYEKYGISSDNAPLEQYNSTAWVEYMMAQCSMFTACHSFATFAEKNPGSEGVAHGRIWVGLMFDGPRATIADFQRDRSNRTVRHSAAYNK